jgi:hypothetical protein
MAGNGFIRIDDSQIRELDGLLSGTLPRELDKARRIALARTRRGVAMRMSTLITDRGEVKYNVGAMRVRRGIKITSIRNSAFFVIGSNKPLSLTSFLNTSQRKGRKPPKGSSRRRRIGAGLFFSVRKGEKLRISSGFILNVNSRQAFRREFMSGQRGRQVHQYPIKRLVGPSIANMMNRNNAEEDLVKFLQERFDSELESAINYAIKRRR